MILRRLLVALLAVVTAISGLATGTTTATAAILTYDAVINARVGDLGIALDMVGEPKEAKAREWSASPMTSAARTPTTPSATGVATEAAGSSRIFRAVEPGELADLASSGQFRLGGWAEGLEGKYFWPTQAQAE